MVRILKILFKTFLIAVGLILLYIIWKWNYEPTTVHNDQSTYNTDVYAQLQFLKSESNHGAGEKLQNDYPEGYVLFYAIYGLTWASLIDDMKPENALFKEGITEIEKSISAVNDSIALSRFQSYLPLEYGAFYRGWTNYLLGKYLTLIPQEKRKNQDVITFKQNCIDISCALEKNDHPFLETYSGSSWPADNMVAMASLKLHDKLYESEYDLIIKKWLLYIQYHLDPDTKLIPHLFDGNTGKILQGARGSSQSLMLPFLLELDTTMAKTHYEIYKTHFQFENYGVYGIYEFPGGANMDGDLDSGPVIFGLGASATIASQRTFYVFGDRKYSKRIRNQNEITGFPITKNNKKRFLAGKMLMADVFMAWANSIER
jgi:hypothetical protein